MHPNRTHMSPRHGRAPLASRVGPHQRLEARQQRLQHGSTAGVHRWLAWRPLSWSILAAPCVILLPYASRTMACDFLYREETTPAEFSLRHCTCSKAARGTADAHGEAQRPWQLGGYHRL